MYVVVSCYVLCVNNVVIVISFINVVVDEKLCVFINIKGVIFVNVYF